MEKRVGDEVIGATINKTGSFTFAATKVGKDTALANIIRMVQDAQGSKVPIQRIVDVVSGYFTPAVMILAILGFILWYDFGPEPRLSYALIVAVTTMIMACPCALGMATPMSLTTRIGLGAKASSSGRVTRCRRQKGCRPSSWIKRGPSYTAGRPLHAAHHPGAPRSTGAVGRQPYSMAAIVSGIRLIAVRDSPSANRCDDARGMAR